jgi:hypothetical protein
MALVMLTIAITIARRPDQFSHPYVWNEEGVDILPSYLAHGFASMFEPLGGYYVLVPRAIWLIALKLDFLNAPTIAVWLGTLVCAAVVVAVAYAPTQLRWPYLCAMAVLCVPTNAEVFGYPLLTFFWTSLLLFLAVIWDVDRGRLWLRAAFIVIAGTSSPLVFPAAALLGLRAIIERQKSEWIAVGIAVACCGFELASPILSSGFNRTFIQSGIDLFAASNMFVGALFLGPRYAFYVPSGILILVAGTAAIWLARSRLEPAFYLLVLGWLATVAAVLARSQIELLDPLARAGPRYFFVPFVLLTWCTMWLAAVSTVSIRVALLALCATGIVAVLGHMSERDDVFDWHAEISKCLSGPAHTMPVHFFGEASHVYSVSFTQEECRALYEKSFMKGPVR